MERCRVAEVLNNLKDPAGEKELKTIFTDIPTLAPDVALILGKQGNFEATQYLRGRLARREDPTDSNLLYRARNATSLYKGGDPSALAVFQELLRIKNARVRSLVCGLFVEMGDRKLLVILQPTIENVDVDVALNACIAAGAIAMPDFRGRWLEVED
jgi:HEAT repeat protein